MDVIRLVRAIGGLLSIMTLLGLFVLSVINPDLTLSKWTVGVLLTMVAGLLGIDMAFANSQLNISMSSNKDGEDGNTKNDGS